MHPKSVAIALTFLICARSASAVVLPQDFSTTQGTNGIFYEWIGDSRLTNVLNPAPAGASDLTFFGDYQGPIDPLPTYNYQIFPGYFPFVQVDTAHEVLIMHPGTSGFDLGQPTANIGASVRVQVAVAGLYSVSGGWARDNVNVGWGDGVDALVVKDSDLDSPLFSTHISSAHVVDVTQPFAGTGTAMFNLQLPLSAGESLRFVVFSDGQGQDGTFDSTAFRVAVAQVPEPSSFVIVGCAVGTIVLFGWRRHCAAIRS